MDLYEGERVRKQSAESVLTSVEEAYKKSTNPQDILSAMLEGVCCHYDAEMALAIDVNLDLHCWTPVVWFRAGSGFMCDTVFDKFEITERFNSWLDALPMNEQVMVSRDDIVDKFPVEAEQYCRLGVDTVIGVPAYNGMQGFLIVKNPKRYLDDRLFLRVMVISVFDQISHLRVMNINDIDRDAGETVIGWRKNNGTFLLFYRH